jgi:hypothetical protein
VSFTLDNAVEVYIAADKYQLSSLVASVKEFIQVSLSKETVCFLLAKAVMMKAHELVGKTISFPHCLSNR